MRMWHMCRCALPSCCTARVSTTKPMACSLTCWRCT
ncbi:hypothetical protein HaLaN_12897, partial [Haematococcus lacustris]